jgi:predicted transcriptional regulator
MKPPPADRIRRGADPPPLSEAESVVLRALWEHGPGTIRQLHQALGRPWAYTTLQTLLHRLEGKGCASRDTAGMAHVYRAAASRDELLRRRLKGLADELCGGVPAPLVLALVQGHRYSVEEIRRFRSLLDELEAPPTAHEARPIPGAGAGDS